MANMNPIVRGVRHDGRCVDVLLASFRGEQFDLRIDVWKLLDLMAPKALHRKSGKSTTACGAVTVRSMRPSNL